MTIDKRWLLSLWLATAGCEGGMIYDEEDPFDPEAAVAAEGSEALLAATTFAATADATVTKDSPSLNSGSSTTMDADLSPEREIFVKFVVTGLSAPASSAKVRLWVVNGTANGPTIRQTSSTWSESTITWSNRPSSSSAVLANRGSVSPGAWVEFDVTSVLTQNGTYSFQIVAESSDSMGVNSREAASNRPQLLVQTGTVSTGTCTAFGAQSNAGTLKTAALLETSGIAASRAHVGVIYAHNDSGGGSKFYAISSTGASIGTFAITNATVNDSEDIAIGPCPSGSCVFLGDIGDNDHQYSTRSVYRIAEPNVSVGSSVGTVNITAERFRFRYPDGVFHNAETLLVHPTSGDIYVVTKEAAGVASKVFKFPQPLDASATVTLLAVTTLAVPGPSDSDISGGDISPAGDAVLLRTNSKAFLFRITGGAFDAVFSTAHTTSSVPNESNGESIGWAPDGRGFYSVSEGGGAMLHATGCAP